MSYGTPIAGGTVNIAATTTSSRVLLGSTDDSVRTVVIYNAGSSDVFIRFGDSTVTAVATTDFPVPAGIPVAFDRGGATYVAAIYGSGSGTVYFTPMSTVGL